MNRLSLALLILFAGSVAAHGQSVMRASQSSLAPVLIESTTEDTNQILAANAITALRRLNTEVIIYRSLGDFEEEGKLAKVSFAQFASDLQSVTNEVEPMLSRMPQGRLKTAITNALESYRDGAFWWGKVNQSGVVHVSALTYKETNTSSDSAFLASVPYTVVIHWRQANRYLKRAEEIVDRPGK